ncbi:MAG: MotA/TolQ/ExbB proton channel family protein [Pseudomonadota bacterium]
MEDDSVVSEGGEALDGVEEAVAEPAVGIFARALEWVDLGGPVVLILLLASIVGLAIILMKLVEFSAAKVSERKNAERLVSLYRAGQVDEALRAASVTKGPAAQTVALAIEGRATGRPEAELREDVVRYGADRLEELRGGFKTLEIIGTLAPLLGLFGTVLGMIEAFQQLEAAGSKVDPSILSGGIWQALLTTAVGLAVAMPAIIALNWFERRLEKLGHAMGSLASQVFTVGAGARGGVRG